MIERSSLTRPDLGTKYHDGATGTVLAPTSPAVAEASRAGAPTVPAGRRPWARAGLGYRLFGGDLYDPFRDRTYSGKALRDRGLSWWVQVRRGRWLALDGRVGPPRYVLFDPDTFETAPVRGFYLRFVSWMLDDGRVMTTDPETRRAIALDPETGDRRDLDLEADSTFCMGRTPNGSYVVAAFGSRDGRTRHSYARLDAKTLAVTPFPALEHAWEGRLQFALVAATDEDTLVGILDERQIVRVRAGEDTVENLFPR
jgi:hypothetical protein